MTGTNSLIEGYRRFRKGAYAEQRARFDSLSVDGQSPKVMVIACSDSRVDPTIIFDAGPGEMFVVRNVANLVPPFETDGGRHGVSAALEFAVTQLEVEAVIVLGHGQCGGVNAALTGRFKDAPPGEGGFIAHWIDLLDDARDRVIAQGHAPGSKEAERVLEHEAVRVSLENLRTFPCVAKRERQGRLTLHGAWFAIRHGQLHWLDEATDQFGPIED
jgi:carbonic anhydrase